MEVDCPDFHTQTEETNKNNRKNDNMKKENTDSSDQTTDKCIEKKEDIPEKSIAEANKSSTDEDNEDYVDVKIPPQSDEDGDYVCDLCEHCFSTKRDRDIHERYHCCVSPPSVLCEICKKDFTREEVKQHVEDHVREMTAKSKSTQTDSSSSEDEDEEDEEQNKCDKCHLSFDTHEELLEHIFREEYDYMKNKKPFMCYCCERFEYEVDYKRHKRNCPSTEDYNHHYDEKYVDNTKDNTKD